VVISITNAAADNAKDMNDQHVTRLERVATANISVGLTSTPLGH